MATLSPVRGAVAVEGEPAAPVLRLGASTVTTGDDGLAELRLDAGPLVLLDSGTEVAVRDGATLTFTAGRAFTDVPDGLTLAIETEVGTLRVSDAGVSLRQIGGAIEVEVLRGEVSWHRGEDARGIAAAGNALRLVEGAEPTVTPTRLWGDWTGGLARARSVDGAPAGVGQLEARVPGELGVARWPLTVRRLDVRVRVDRDLAITEVDQVFFNPASETVEGLYRIRVPEEAVLQRFAVDRDGRLIDGYVRERAQAAQAYQQRVYRGSTEDPALLEWDAAGSYKAKIYPIPPGATRRIVIRYAEWLRPAEDGGPRLYRYPMAGGQGAPRIQEFALRAEVQGAGAERVRAGLGAVVEQGEVRLRRSDFQPRSDFWMELVGGDAGPTEAWTAIHEPPPRDPNASAPPNEADESDYFYLPLVLPMPDGDTGATGELDVVVVADVSAATDRSHLELGRSVIEALASHLGEGDRLAVVRSDLGIRAVSDGDDGQLGPITDERVDVLLDGLARVPSGGATDLGAALTAAAALLDRERDGFVLYVGDGAPTVGELRAEALLERIARLPEPVRMYAVAVGADAQLDLLDGVVSGGGLAIRVEERRAAADAALRVLAHGSRPIVHGVTVELGDGIENVFPRRARDAVVGDLFPVTGRVRESLPSQATVRGTFRGEPYEQTIALSVQSTDETTDLRLRWAQERLRQLLAEGATREEVAELGTRYGLITPFTSFYVPSHTEVSALGLDGLRWVDQPLLEMNPPASGWSLASQTAAAVMLMPLTLSGCDVLTPSGESAPVSEMEEAWADDSEAEGGAGERYAIEGPSDAPASTAAAAPEEPMAEAEPAPEPSFAPAPPPGAAANLDGARRESSRRSGGEAMARRRAGDPSGGLEQVIADGFVEEDRAVGDVDDLANAQLGAMGYVTGEANGSGGLALQGTGRGGGGTGQGTIGLGDLGTIGHGAGSGSGSGYGRGGGTLRSRAARVPRIRSGAAEVRGGLSREVIRRVIRRHLNEVRFCYEQELNRRPDLEGRLGVSFVIGGSGTVQSATIAESTMSSPPVEACVVAAFRRWTFPAPDGGGVVLVKYPFTFTAGGSGGSPGVGRRAPSNDAAHRRSRCSDASRLPLADRRALWRERLQSANNANAWVRVLSEARQKCEARSWRDQRALLSLMMARAGNIPGLLSLYSALPAYSAARSYVRGRILSRVRTAEDLRLVRQALGLGGRVDWALVSQILERATDPADRIRALRELREQYPLDFQLALRLMHTLEEAERVDEARRLAERLRADPYADASVRTEIGEMYLRLDPDGAEARRAFSEIVEFAPLDELARRRLGDLYRAHEWYDDAYRQYETLREIRPDDPTTYLLLAQAAAGAGRVDEALRFEARLAESAQPGASSGLARVALLWSSVRFARLRQAARAASDAEQLESLARRMRRSGVLREAGEVRVSLVWSHPDAELSLWAAQPGLSLTRPPELFGEFGLEAFDLEEQEDGTYRFEVRRSGELRGAMEAQLVVVWDEGKDGEQVELVDLTFDGERRAFAWTLNGRTLAEASPSGSGR